LTESRWAMQHSTLDNDNAVEEIDFEFKMERNGK